MATKQQQQAQNPLILRCNRIMEAFAKSDDERDFYLDRHEGFLVYVDLDKPDDDLLVLEKELEKNKDRYCMIPKLTFYETKKIMEGFINEKVYDIDTKEKLLDIIQSKEAREHFLEFIHDHHTEQEKWTTFYQERSRIRIIEWLRVNNFHFVFEEDLELPRLLIEKLKKELFQTKVGKDVANARKILFAKAKTYYSNEALNPRPKRGRPPKQTLKTEVEPQITTDIYTTVPNGLLGFLFIPDLHTLLSASFSSKFGNEEDQLTARRPTSHDNDTSIESLNSKLLELRALSSKWIGNEDVKTKPSKSVKSAKAVLHDDFDEEEDDDDFEERVAVPARLNGVSKKNHIASKPAPKAPAPSKSSAPKNFLQSKTGAKKPAPAKLSAKAAAKPKAKVPARPIRKAKAAAPKAAPKKTILKKLQKKPVVSNAKKKLPVKHAAKKAAPPAKSKKPAPKPIKKSKALRPMVKIKPKKR